MPAICQRAFVTGGAGFIGSHIVDALLREQADVVVYDSFVTGRREFLANHAENPAVHIIEGDVMDRDGLHRAMAGCDFVFHFQANADVRGGPANPRVDLDQNILCTWNVVEAMRQHGIKQIAFASSAAVYGEPEVFPTPENYSPLQTSLYGASKLSGEAIIEAYCEYYGMRCFIFRFVSWIGERYSHGVIFDFLKKLSQSPKRLEILGDGEQRKSYLYVKDGVAGILRAIQQAEGNKVKLNLGHDDCISVVQVARLVTMELGLPDVQLYFTGTKRGWVGDSPFVQLDTSKIKKLGWAPQTAIDEGIRRTVRYLLENPAILQQRS